jgi:hypothetical protein
MPRTRLIRSALRFTTTTLAPAHVQGGAVSNNNTAPLPSMHTMCCRRRPRVALPPKQDARQGKQAQCTDVQCAASKSASMPADLQLRLGFRGQLGGQAFSERRCLGRRRHRRCRPRRCLCRCLCCKVQPMQPGPLELAPHHPLEAVRLLPGSAGTTMSARPGCRTSTNHIPAAAHGPASPAMPHPPPHLAT